MTKWMIAILATALTLAFAPTAWAECTSHSYLIKGKSIHCVTCCLTGGSCYTTCT
jgi:hypothetical protein